VATQRDGWLKEGDGWLKEGDGWLSREMGGLVEIWVAKKGDRWLSRERSKQRSGLHTVAAKTYIQKSNL
jgi:hypothetical protein